MLQVPSRGTPVQTVPAHLCGCGAGMVRAVCQSRVAGGRAGAYLVAMIMRAFAPSLVLVFVLVFGPAGCAALFKHPASSVTAVPAPEDALRPRPRPQAGVAVRGPVIGATGARSAAALDRSTPAERAAAVAVPSGGAILGRTVVALGSPAEPGFWLRTALVSAPGPGTVRLDAGTSVQVELRPGAGAAQLSLAAYRALGLGLTELPQVTVLAR